MRRTAARIGYDPWLHTAAWVEAARKALAAKGRSWSRWIPTRSTPSGPSKPAPSERNADRSSRMQPAGEVLARQAARDRRLAGRAQGGCGRALGARFDRLGVQRARYRMSSHTPVALAYAIVNADGTADLFVAPRKGERRVSASISAMRVRMREPRRVRAPALKGFAGKRVAADPEQRGRRDVRGARCRRRECSAARDPVILPKAIKNPAEIAGPEGCAGARRRRALAAPPAAGSRRSAPRAASPRCRPPTSCAHSARRPGDLRDLSFDTISATGPNGAIPHYKVTDEIEPADQARPALSRRFGRPVCRTAPPI